MKYNNKRNFQKKDKYNKELSGMTVSVRQVKNKDGELVSDVNGSFIAGETITGGTSGATATLAASSFDTNQTGRILVSTFASIPTAGDSLQFNATDGNCLLYTSDAADE